MTAIVLTIFHLVTEMPSLLYSLSYKPAMAKFNCGMLSVLGTFLAVESLDELEE